MVTDESGMKHHSPMAACRIPCDVKFHNKWQAGLVVTGMCALLPACNDDEIRAYRAPKQQARAAAPEAPAESRVSWTVPQGWESVASDQPMRLATFKPGQDMPEVTLSAFPGDSGGLLANINRWRGQLGLPPIGEAELAKTSESGTFEGVAVTTVDITGSAGQQLLGAVVTPGDGKTWFVKAIGEPAAIAKLKPVFGAFARSFRLQREAPTVSSSAGAGDVQARLSAWKGPSHWAADPNASTMVAAAYDAKNTEGGAKITATMLLNDGGGVLSNINRWRDQLGLPPVMQLDQQPVTKLGVGSMWVDLAAADNSRRMIAAIVPSNGQTWFFKITGTPKGVEAERPHYEQLVRGVGLGEGSK